MECQELRSNNNHTINEITIRPLQRIGLIIKTSFMDVVTTCVNYQQKNPFVE